MQPRNLGTHGTRHPDLSVQRDTQSVDLVSEFEPVFASQMHEVLGMHERMHEPVDSGKGVPERLRDVPRRRATALGDDLQDREGLFDRHDA